MDVDFGELVGYAAGHIVRNFVEALFDAVESFAVVETYVPCKGIYCHLRVCDYGCNSFPVIILHFVQGCDANVDNYFRLNKFFIPLYD